jgi:hypothetical protein
VPRVEYDKLTDDRLGEPSAVVRARAEAARRMQHARFGADSEHELRTSSQLRKTARIFSNAGMGPAEVGERCRLDDAGKALFCTLISFPSIPISPCKPSFRVFVPGASSAGSSAWSSAVHSLLG